MECLSAVYEWRADAAASPNISTCSCPDLSTAEEHVQLLQADVELRHLRDRVRKSLVRWLGGEAQHQKGAPIRIHWQVTANELVERLCFWSHTSALSKVGMTPAVAELLRHHRRLEGGKEEPPASKNTLILVVWDLAATVQARLGQWRELLASSVQRPFDGVIVVRAGDVIPIWTWEADTLRNRPAFMQVCSRMLSMELWHYRQHCQETSSSEKQLLRDHEPHLTPMGLRWRARPQLQSAPRPRLSHMQQSVSKGKANSFTSSKSNPVASANNSNSHMIDSESDGSGTRSNSNNEESDKSESDDSEDGSDESIPRAFRPLSSASSSGASSLPLQKRQPLSSSVAKTTKAAPYEKRRHWEETIKRRL